MKRREFIPLSLKTALAVSLSGGILARCSFISSNLDGIMGQSIQSLRNKQVEYEGNISCYSLTDFKPKLQDAEKAFIFSKDDKVIGFSIKLKPSAKDSLKIPQEATIAYDNAFGSSAIWKDNNVHKRATLSKPYNDVKSFIFYSEYVAEGEKHIL